MDILEAEEVLFGEGGSYFEKARAVGDIHPNGKWVWTQLPSGKFDWRTIKQKKEPGQADTSGGKKSAETKTKQKKTIEDFARETDDKVLERAAKSGDEKIAAAAKKELARRKKEQPVKKEEKKPEEKKFQSPKESPNGNKEVPLDGRKLLEIKDADGGLWVAWLNGDGTYSAARPHKDGYADTTYKGNELSTGSLSEGVFRFGNFDKQGLKEMAAAKKKFFTKEDEAHAAEIYKKKAEEEKKKAKRRKEIEKVESKVDKTFNKSSFPDGVNRISYRGAVMGLTDMGDETNYSTDYGFHMTVDQAIEAVNKYAPHAVKAMKLRESLPPEVQESVNDYIEDPNKLGRLTKVLVDGGDFNGDEDLERFYRDMETFIEKGAIREDVEMSRSIGKDLWNKIKDASEFENLALSSWSMGDKSGDFFGDYRVIWSARKGEKVAPIGTIDLLEFVGSSDLKFKITERGSNYVKVETI